MTWTIAYDPERMVCGCVILQVGMGATVPHERIAGLPWVTSRTPGMRLLPVDEDRLAKLQRIHDARGDAP